MVKVGDIVRICGKRHTGLLGKVRRIPAKEEYRWAVYVRFNWNDGKEDFYDEFVFQSDRANVLPFYVSEVETVSACPTCELVDKTESSLCKDKWHSSTVVETKPVVASELLGA